MPYHHGNLREALVDAGVALARSGGPDAVVLRAVSRDAGVSHNAAYRHFADREDLLAAVQDRCFAALADGMLAALAACGPGPDDVALAWARLEAVGRAYVTFAVDEPGWFRTSFGGATRLSPNSDPDRDAYRILNDVLDGLVGVGAVPADRRPGAELAAWAAVHGIATLLVDGPLRNLDTAERAAAVVKVLATVAAGL